MSDTTDILKVLVPPLMAAFLSGYLVSRWKTREDAVEKRLDELISQIDAVAAVANQYWQKNSHESDVKLLATKVMAGIARLDGLRSAIAPFLSSTANAEIVAIAAEFLRMSTGGDFGVHNRASDLTRSLNILMIAASYSVAIRNARMKDLNGWRRRR